MYLIFIMRYTGKVEIRDNANTDVASSTADMSLISAARNGNLDYEIKRMNQFKKCSLHSNRA